MMEWHAQRSHLLLKRRKIITIITVLDSTLEDFTIYLEIIFCYKMHRFLIAYQRNMFFIGFFFLKINLKKD